MQRLENLHCKESLERELNLLQSSFVAQVSHEFRTPLTIILLSAQLLELYENEYTAEEKLKYIRQIQEAVRKMNNFFNEALENFQKKLKSPSLTERDLLYGTEKGNLLCELARNAKPD